MKWEMKNDVPVLIVCGQSNAHGHGTRLATHEMIMEPLRNVWGLDREKNQAYGLSQVVWNGFTSYGMNLGEVQDHTCCLATEFARSWQACIDEGMELPDLYIIQMSIGGQGIAKYEKGDHNMWYPNRPHIIRNGVLGQVDISLYPLAMEILPLAMQSIKNQAYTPRVIGFHWNQWETEVDTGGIAVEEARQNYKILFDGFRKAIGQSFPIYLYRPLSDVYNNPEGVESITRLFNELIQENNYMKMVDVSQSELFDASRLDKGIFQNDLVHYTAKVQRWFARYQWENLENK